MKARHVSSTYTCTRTSKLTQARLHLQIQAHTHRKVLSHTKAWYLSIIRNSCCAKNETMLPVLAEVLNIHFLTKYYNIIVLLSKVK